MGDITSICQELLPQACCYVFKCHICTTGVVWVQINDHTHIAVLWNLYDDHHPSQQFEEITRFTRYIWLKTCSKHHFSKHVLCQFGYEHAISQPPPPFKGGVIIVINNSLISLCRSFCYQCNTNSTSLNMYN